jgi:hypothetical protein
MQRSTHKILVWKSEDIRTYWRRSRIWEDNIKIDITGTGYKYGLNSICKEILENLRTFLVYTTEIFVISIIFT